MEQIIVCAFVAAYAVLVDLTAVTLRSQGDIYQTGPMTLWGAIISVVTVVQILLVFRAQISFGCILPYKASSESQ